MKEIAYSPEAKEDLLGIKYLINVLGLLSLHILF
jgi:hypothetical protein